MPLLKNRGTHLRVYRPNGSRYANGKTERELSRAIASAAAEFFYEFGEMPKQEETYFEVLGVTAGWAATVIEVKEPKVKPPYICTSCLNRKHQSCLKGDCRCPDKWHDLSAEQGS